MYVLKFVGEFGECSENARKESIKIRFHGSKVCRYVCMYVLFVFLIFSYPASIIECMYVCTVCMRGRALAPPKFNDASDIILSSKKDNATPSAGKDDKKKKKEEKKKRSRSELEEEDEEAQGEKEEGEKKAAPAVVVEEPKKKKSKIVVVSSTPAEPEVRKVLCVYVCMYVFMYCTVLLVSNSTRLCT